MVVAVALQERRLHLTTPQSTVSKEAIQKRVELEVAVDVLLVLSLMALTESTQHLRQQLSNTLSNRHRYQHSNTVT